MLKAAPFCSVSPHRTLPFTPSFPQDDLTPTWPYSGLDPHTPLPLKGQLFLGYPPVGRPCFQSGHNWRDVGLVMSYGYVRADCRHNQWRRLVVGVGVKRYICRWLPTGCQWLLNGLYHDGHPIVNMLEEVPPLLSGITNFLHIGGFSYRILYLLLCDRYGFATYFACNTMDLTLNVIKRFPNLLVRYLT